MPELIFKGNPQFTDPFVPWRELINMMFSAVPDYETCSSTYIVTLSGGVSGATVVLLFPEGNYKPLVVKIDVTDSIQSEFERYRKYLGGKNDPHLARLLFPTAGSPFTKRLGADGKDYAIIAYSYAGACRKERVNIKSFDQYCRELLEVEAISSVCCFLDQLNATLNNCFYSQPVDRKGIAVRPFDIPALPWDTLAPLVETVASFIPDKEKFIREFPEQWDQIHKAQKPITYNPLICHGDLRCANVLSIEQEEVFLIDFGLTEPSHPASDFSRLEADLLLRIGLNETNPYPLFKAIVNQAFSDFNDGNSAILKIIKKIRILANNVAIYYKIYEKGLTELIYRLYLLGHATRLVRKDYPELRQNRKRQAYLWFILSLAKSLISLEKKEEPSPLPIPLSPEAIRDMQECGLTDFFWGPERRNHQKRSVLEEHNNIKLVAHTGKSYLDDTVGPDGNPNGRFYNILKNRLANDELFKVQIVLLNPYSVEGSKLGIAEARGALQGPELDLDYHEKYTELFKRFSICIKSFKRLHHQFGQRIELRISHYSTDATILFSEQAAFIEPYLVGRLSMRYAGPTLMNAPEMMVSLNSEMYAVAGAQFQFLWQRAITIDEYESRLEDFKKDFMQSERLRRKLVALHESWFAIDPIVGCPNHCVYCFLTPFHLNQKAPFIYRSAEDAYMRLAEYQPFLWQGSLMGIEPFRSDPRLPVPVACGNYTEMLDDENMYDIMIDDKRFLQTTNYEQLKRIIESHIQLVRSFSSAQKPVLCLITKKPIPHDFINFLYEKLSRAMDLRIALFTSISFLPDGFEKGVKIEDLLNNLNLLFDLNLKVGGAEGKYRRVAGIHFWRPIIHGLNSSDLEKKITTVKDHRAVSSVAVGLKLSKRLLNYITQHYGLPDRMGHSHHLSLPIEIREFKEQEYFPQEVREQIIEAASNKQHWVFLNSSCAISHAFGRPDYNASYQKCSLAGHGAIQQVMNTCGISQKYESREKDCNRWIYIGESIPQEKQTFIRQMLGVEVEANVEATHEWRGNVSRVNLGLTCRGSNCPEDQRRICDSFYRSREQAQ